MIYGKTESGHGVDENIAQVVPQEILIPADRLPAPIEFGSDEFWQEFVDTAQCVHDAKQKKRLDLRKDWRETLPAAIRGIVESPVPEFITDSKRNCGMGIRNCAEYAEMVHDEWPTSIPTMLVQWLLKKGHKVRDIFNVGGPTFAMGPVEVGSLIGEAIKTVSPSCFNAKWVRKSARPEEIAYAIATGEIEPPAAVKDHLDSIVDWRAVKEDKHAFTTYPEGCPGHPRDPAMHAAAAGISVIIGVMMDISESAFVDVPHTAWCIAGARNSAGVHLMEDCRNGLWMGEEVMELWLPDRLAQRGADKSQVLQLVRQHRTNWLLKG